MRRLIKDVTQSLQKKLPDYFLNLEGHLKCLVYAPIKSVQVRSSFKVRQGRFYQSTCGALMKHIFGASA